MTEKNGFTRRQQRRGGFTMTELLIVLLIVCLLTPVVFSAGGLLRGREMANRVRCASNLRQVGQAMLMYANENRGAYPRTVYKPGDAPTQYTGVDCKKPFEDAGAPKANDVTAALMLLLRTQDVTSTVFVCPSTDALPIKFEGAATAQDIGNFKSEDTLSYSVANAYPSADAVKLGYKWTPAALGAEFALAADMNPGTVGESDVTTAKGPKDQKAPLADMMKANSLNHRGEGQNVLFGDGHVEFARTPFVGVKFDNIYTVSGGTDGKVPTGDTVAGAPKWAGDSVLLPAATRNPHTKTPDQEEAAAVAEFKQFIPKFKQQVAEGEARLIKAKQELAAMEKEVAEAEARLNAAGKK